MEVLPAASFITFEELPGVLGPLLLSVTHPTPVLRVHTVHNALRILIQKVGIQQGINIYVLQLLPDLKLP